MAVRKRHAGVHQIACAVVSLHGNHSFAAFCRHATRIRLRGIIFRCSRRSICCRRPVRWIHRGTARKICCTCCKVCPLKRNHIGCLTPEIHIEQIQFSVMKSQPFGFLQNGIPQLCIPQHFLAAIPGTNAIHIELSDNFAR